MLADTDILREHAEEAAFLWTLRKMMVRRANQRLADLAEHDERIEAHVDGLRLAGEQGGEIAIALLQEQPGAGTAFVVAALADEPEAPPTWLDPLVALLCADAALIVGTVAGLTWTQDRYAQKLIASWYTAGHPNLRTAALGVAVARGAEVDDHLRAACSSTDAPLRRVALAAIGRLGRRDLRNLCRSAMSDADDECRAAAAWSLSLVGSDAEAALRTQAERGGPWTEDLLHLAARRLSRTAVMAWIKDHGNRPERLRRSLILAGHHGDTVVMPWILGKMAVPALARLAGAAFALITGVDLEDAEMTTRPPKDFQTGPTDDPADDNVAPDPDEYLPWPDVAKVTAWWESHRTTFPDNVRLLLGRAIEPTHLAQVLRTGNQPQRAAAALEMAVLAPGQPLFDVSAPALHQVRLLATSVGIAADG